MPIAKANNLTQNLVAIARNDGTAITDRKRPSGTPYLD